MGKQREGRYERAGIDFVLFDEILDTPLEWTGLPQIDNIREYIHDKGENDP